MANQTPHGGNPNAPPARRSSLGNYVSVGVVLIGIGLLLGLQAWQKTQPPGDSTATMIPAKPRPVPSFSGGTEGLPHTAIAPALRTILPQGKNAVWCSSFQVAWNKMKNDIIKAPINLRGAQNVASCLNAALQGEQDLPLESYYATAGFINNGIADQIRQAMARKFPVAPLPRFVAENSPKMEPIVAYAYMSASVLFSTQFNDQPAGLKFKDSAGKETCVASFGFSGADQYTEVLAQDAQILWLGDSSGAGKGNVDEFVVDLCKRSQPSQIVLAMVKPKATLEETYSYVRRAVDSRFSYRHPDSLKVPKMFWRVSHHFGEIEGRGVQNPGFEDYLVVTAQQDMEFRLDKSGAKLISEARLEIEKSEATKVADNQPLNLIFDCPFLLYIKKRDAVNPMFVMWVDNAELLTKR